jgi:hypothetical protein
VLYRSLVVVALCAGVAHADEAFISARLPGGPDAAAPGMGASVEGGWGGARAEAVGAVSAEALLYGRITARASVTYDVGKAKPSAYLSYVFLDPYRHAIGLLVGMAVKTEGMTEPDGEVEGTVALSRRVGAGLLTGSITFGADPDFHDHDGEAALALMQPVADHTAVGGLARGRSGLGSTNELGANWDAIAGAVARTQLGVYTLTAIGGVDTIGAVTGGTRTGALATLAVGAWW